jgi:hypothetical protein
MSSSEALARRSRRAAIGHTVAPDTLPPNFEYHLEQKRKIIFGG